MKTNVSWNIGKIRDFLAQFIFQVQAQKRNFAPATFCFGKNRTILTMKIEYHMLDVQSRLENINYKLTSLNIKIDFLSNLIQIDFFHYYSFKFSFDIQSSKSCAHQVHLIQPKTNQFSSPRRLRPLSILIVDQHDQSMGKS